MLQNKILVQDSKDERSTRVLELSNTKINQTGYKNWTINHEIIAWDTSSPV